MEENKETIEETTTPDVEDPRETTSPDVVEDEETTTQTSASSSENDSEDVPATVTEETTTEETEEETTEEESGTDEETTEEETTEEETEASGYDLEELLADLEAETGIEVPFLEKPLEEYSTSEGLLFLILITLVCMWVYNVLAD